MNWNASEVFSEVFKTTQNAVLKATERARAAYAQKEQENTPTLYFERLLTATGGFAHFELLYCACKLDLFGYLERKGQASLREISRDLKLPEYSLRVLLMGNSYLGLVENMEGTYSNTPLAEEFIQGRPQSMWPTLHAYHSLLYPAMRNLSESLQAGTNAGLKEFEGFGNTLYERLESHPDLEKIFHDWMHGLGKIVGITEPVLELLRPTLENVMHLVDYGGGDGSNAIKLCKHYPHLEVTIFDSASVCKLAKKKIREADLSDRISLKEGNFLEDPFIEGVDGLMFNHIFNIYSDKVNTQLLRKSHDSLAKGGVAIVFNSVSFDSENGPAFAPVLSAYFLGLATGQGMVYPLKDYDQWYENAGFKQVEKVHLPEINHGLVIAKK